MLRARQTHDSPRRLTLKAMVHVVLFAQASQLAGASVLEWPVKKPQSTDAFWDWILGEHPSLASLRFTCRLATNGEYLAEDTPIYPGDELAIIPPVSGG